MPAPTTCTVSGTIRDAGGNAVVGATVAVNALKPFIHTTDSSLVANYSVSTTTASDGTFSLVVVETTTVSVSLILTIKSPLGTGANSVIASYSVTIPNAATATLASLISGQ